MSEREARRGGAGCYPSRVIALLQLAAALYLAAGVAGGVGVGLGSRRALRTGVLLLGAGAFAHGVCFALLHKSEPVPSLTELPFAVSLMAWVLALAFLVFARRAAGLVVAVGPLAFLGARAPRAGPPGLAGGGAWPHLHVLLASAGLALLAVAAVAGAAWLLENRRLKRKRPMLAGPGARLPSLEALDHVNAAALTVGFPLLTLGVVTGMLWVHTATGRLVTGSPHEAWNLIAWAVYGALVAARFAARQGARDAAASAVAGFLFLLFAVVGVGMLA
jgi:ABC-type transport system involved in cytochrome c biogenesis permease subunit